MTMDTPPGDAGSSAPEPAAAPASPPPAPEPAPVSRTEPAPAATPAPAAPPPPRDKLPFPLQDNETVIAVVHRHWMNLWPLTALYAAIALVPPIVIIWIFAASGWFDGLTRNIILIIAAIWLLYWGIRALLNWYRYANDLWTITNQRIVDSFRVTPINLRISTADLVNIQDMSVQRRGIFQTLLNYGDVVCDTAGAGKSQTFVLSGIPNPQEIQLLVDKERDRERMRRA